MVKKKKDLEGAEEEKEVISQKSYTLKDIPGIGDATLKKLKDAGIISIRALAMMPKSKLMEDAGIGDKTADKLIKTAQDVEKMGFTPADIIWEKRKELKLSSNRLRRVVQKFIAPAIFILQGSKNNRIYTNQELTKHQPRTRGATLEQILVQMGHGVQILTFHNLFEIYLFYVRVYSKISCLFNCSHQLRGVKQYFGGDAAPC